MATNTTWQDRMTNYPCAFNLQSPNPGRELLENMTHNVSTEKPTGKYSEMEEIRNKNLLTWVEHLNKSNKRRAKEINKEVLAATNNSNIPSLGNRVFILSGEGNDIDAEKYLHLLEVMRKRPDFEDLMAEAKAEQAYYYSRMGAFEMSVKLFKEVINKKPLNLLWKYGLGLMYRRMTNFNVCFSVTKEYNRSELMSLAIENLREVTQDDDPKLRGLAYAQLIGMLNTCSKTEQANCFHGLNGNMLCEKALKDAGDNPTVLCDCGKYYLKSDIDKAIQLVEQSVSMRENTKAYHYLGICYEKKAEKAAMDVLSPNDKRSQQFRRDVNRRRTSGGVNYSSNRNGDNETDKSSHNSRRHSMEYSNSRVLNAASYNANRRHAKSPKNNSVKDHLRQTRISLDQNCSIVNESVKNYKIAIELSKSRNIPALLSLGKLYQRTGRFKKAVQQFRKIIKLEETERGYLVTLIMAYEGAGICLRELSTTDKENEQKFSEQGKEYLTKAISLAADLASMNSCPTHCTTFVGKSFEILKEDIDRMDECSNKGKEYIRLLQLIKDHRGVVTAIEDILKSKTKWDDPEMVVCALYSNLKMGEYEIALTFVNVVALTSGSCLEKDENSEYERSEMKDLKAAIIKVFLFVAWERLQKQSSDAKRIFQKLLATKYREFAEIQSKKEDKDKATLANILIVNDTFQDCEEGLGQSTKISKQLQLVFSQVCGFRSFLNLETTWQDRMTNYPCAFNLQSPNPGRELLENMTHNVSTEKPTGKYSEMEEIRNKNLLTWVEHLNKSNKRRAKEINKEVLAATNNSNIPSLGNRVFILSGEGNDIDAEKYLHLLEVMRKRPDFEDLMAEAKAEQAYYYSRMGAFEMSVKLFKEVINKKPLNLLWKYGLGLMYRRMTNFNVCFSVTKEYNRSELMSLAIENLREVTQDDDPKLRGLAYAQLIGMLNTCSKTEQANCFHGLNGNMLCEKALKDAGDNPTVLCDCGKYYLKSDIDKAIQLVEQSVSMRENTKAYHYLGICYEKKAEKAAMDVLSPNDKRSQQFRRDVNRRRTSGGVNYSSNRNGDNETDKSSHNSRRHSMEYSNSRVLNAASYNANRRHAKSPKNNSVKDHLRQTRISLDQNCSIVNESVKNYKIAIELSKSRNIPALLSLGKLYQRTGRFKKAVQQFRKIIKLEETERGYLVTLIMAYEGAGICLRELSTTDKENEQKFSEQGKEYLTKAISLAADLASMNSCPTHCTTFVGKSFEILKEDIDRMDECSNKGKEYIRLLQLIKDHRGVVTAIEDILKSKTKWDDPEMVVCALYSNLKMGEYEIALTFVNVVALTSGSCLEKDENSEYERSEMKDLKAAIIKVFLFVAWERLQKQSSDAKRIFQKLLATKYREFAEIQSKKEDKDKATLANILIVNDTFQDCEEGLGQSTKISKQLQLVFSQVCGFRSFLNLETTWQDRMTNYPCAFNLQSPNPGRELLENMTHNVSTEKPTGKYSEMEEIRNKNLLTWVEHLNKSNKRRAKEINKEVLAATNNSNIPSLGNRVFILSGEGNDIDAEKYLHLLEVMRKRPDFEDLMAEAKAEQAYYYSRMGAFEMSVKLFKEVINKKPLNLLWKYGLGLMYRRMTNFNVCFSVTKEYNRSELMSLAIENLREVTQDDDPKLRGLAYAQLIGMLNTCSKTEQANCFHGLNGNMLCEKALKDAGDNPTVLCDCGKYYLKSDIDKAIQLVEQSVSMRENTKAYHYLGICYEKKAEKAAMDVLSPNDKRSQQFRRDVNRRRTSGGVNYSSNRNGDNETDKSSHNSRRHSMEYSNSRVLNAASYNANRRHAKSPKNNSVKDHLRQTRISLDQNCSIVNESVKNYKIAIELSKSRNIPALLSLGKLYQRTGRFKKAVQQFRKIIKLEETERGYLVTLIMAYEGAGICLRELSTTDKENEQKFSEQGKEYLTKAISLAADLASMNSCPTHCTTFVGKSFEILKEDIDRMDECSNKGKEYIRLLQLIKDHRGVVTAIEDILKSKTKWDDPEMVVCALYSNLKMGEYEIALTFVNVVALTSGSCLEKDENSEYERSEMKDLKAAIIKVFLFVAWERLQKQSSDAKRIFQKLLATKYREFAEIQSKKEDKDKATLANILIVNDTFQDCEEGLGQSTKISKQLQLVFSQVCGFRSFLNLEENVLYEVDTEMEVLLQEMKKYPIVLIVLTEEERDPLFDQMLQTLPEIKYDKNNSINVFFIQSSGRVIVPDILLRYKQQGFMLNQEDPILSIKAIDKKHTSCLDVTNSCDTYQRPTACLEVTNSNDTAQRPSCCLDETRSSDTDKRDSGSLAVTHSNDPDQRPSGHLDVTNPSDTAVRPSGCLDVTNPSDTNQRPSSCLDVTNPSDTDQRPSSCLDVTNPSDTNQRPSSCLDTDQELNPQCHLNDVIVERIISLVCFMMQLDFNQLKDEYRKK